MDMVLKSYMVLFGLKVDHWAKRREYDGSEWWELRAYPTIPEELF